MTRVLPLPAPARISKRALAVRDGLPLGGGQVGEQVALHDISHGLVSWMRPGHRASGTRLR